jgi:hypothetical protein
METTKNKLSPYASNFFDSLRNYLDTKLYFYGSIQRDDYFQDQSDIDVDIFTDNISTTIYRLQHFLNIEKSKIKKFIMKINDTIIVGRKVVVKRPNNNFRAEISIFDEKTKALVLYEHNRKTELPFLISYFVLILKFFYYKLNMIDRELYKNIKQFLLNSFLDKGYLKSFLENNFASSFVVLDVTSKDKNVN